MFHIWLNTDWKAWVLLNRAPNEDAGDGDDVGSQVLDVRIPQAPHSCCVLTIFTPDPFLDHWHKDQTSTQSRKRALSLPVLEE